MWASSNLRSDAFLLVYDITNRDSLGVLQEFNDLIDIEAETRLDSWERDVRSSKGGRKGSSSAARLEEQPVRPIKIVAGNKCDLQESRQVLAREGLDWARKRGCGFMETSARNTVNIEETFALIVRRVVEARRQALNGSMSSGLSGFDDRRNTTMSLGGSGSLGLGTRRAVTAPLSPLPGGPEKEISFKPAVQKKGFKIKFKELFGRFVCWR